MVDIDKVVIALEKAKQPQSEFVKLMDSFKDPYIVLIACILSLRTNDRTTYPATQIIELSKILVEKYGGKVPCDIEELCKFRGVGRKTANLVLSEGFNKPAICVDVHVHRIFNRLGYLKTKTPEETEFTLREKLPQKYWIPINSLLVTHGQNICKPIKPLCDKCPVEKYCDKAF